MAFVRVPGSGLPPAVAYYNDSDSLTIAGTWLNPATTQNNFKDLIFNPDGTKMYTLGYATTISGRNVFQYTLSTPFDVSTATTSVNDYVNVGGYMENNEAIRFNNNGTKLFVLFDSANQSHSSKMHQYTLSTPYDITSTVTEGTSYVLGNQYDNFRSFLFNDDGSKMFVNRLSSIYEYTLSSLFDTSSATLTGTGFYTSHNSYGISNYGSSSSIAGMQYNSDGTKLFTVHQQSSIGHTAKIVEWSLSTAYDPTTASTNADFNDTSTYFETGEATTASASPTQFITFNNNGSKFFSFNHAQSPDPVKIKEWTVSTPFSMLSSSSGSSGSTSASGPWEYDNTATEADTYPGSTRGANITISNGIKTYIKPVSGTAEEVYVSTRKMGETKNRGELSKSFYDAQNAKGTP